MKTIYKFAIFLLLPVLLLSVFGNLSAAPSAGSVDVTEASIVAIRIY